MQFWRDWQYKNLTILGIGLIVALILSKNEDFQSFLLNLGNLGYLGAFIAGCLFVSVFTVATSAVVLLVLSEKLSPLTIGLLAGLGAVLGDYLIFRYIKDNLISEIRPIYNNLGGSYIKRVFKVTFKTKYFGWLLPIIGAIIVASPLPDEVGISMIGFSGNLKTYQFLLVSFILNAIGIFIIVSASTVVKP